ncbi:thioredoxin family protein [Rugamonas sp.]|uniref:thioredoxin family protein n=1 Tax=Rugamonas sp. TaxID=1926287 RepID=UPI0025F4CE45|nr:thioredoxin family protein [Rugamonas sp.]
METLYTASAPTRAAVDALRGPALLEFGTNWCGHCRAAQGALAVAYAGHAGVPHFKVEDGPGRALGRSFRVKLWPTLIFLRDGVELARLVRPLNAAEIGAAFELINPAA